MISVENYGDYSPLIWKRIDQIEDRKECNDINVKRNRRSYDLFTMFDKYVGTDLTVITISDQNRIVTFDNTSPIYDGVNYFMAIVRKKEIRQIANLKYKVIRDNIEKYDTPEWVMVRYLYDIDKHMKGRYSWLEGALGKLRFLDKVGLNHDDCECGGLDGELDEESDTVGLAMLDYLFRKMKARDDKLAVREVQLLRCPVSLIEPRYITNPFFLFAFLPRQKNTHPLIHRKLYDKNLLKVISSY